MDNTQFEIIMAFLLYLCHTVLAFSIEEKFRGIFLVLAGSTLIYLSTILPLSPIYVLPLLVPIGLIMIIYAVFILYIKDKNKEKE